MPTTLAAAEDNNNSGFRRVPSSSGAQDMPVVPSTAASRNAVVLNYSPSNTSNAGGFSPSLVGSRRPSSSLLGGGGADMNNKENQCPQPPPDLSEETLLAPEHNQVLSKLRFIHVLVDTIIGVARSKAAPLAGLTDSTTRPAQVPVSTSEGKLRIRNVNS